MEIDLNTLPFFEDDNTLNNSGDADNPVVVSSEGGKREKVLVLKPASISEVQPLIDFLKQRKMAVVDLSDAGDDSQRILDFAAGAVYALNGSVLRISDKNNIFLLSPEGTMLTVQNSEV
ncbi:MAG: cell division protein SepF [Clostridia bacterium]|nr:cell division protein SepF [Clostridia bacterium]MBP5593387.1 cell division protein SepF [Clostridia bacterium]MBP5648445.1 cell division protein SepF [Clostridia bacterium]